MKLSLSRSLAVFLTMLLMFCAIGVAPAHAAAALTVNTLADNETDDGFCTLREAIIAANTNANYYGCAATGYGDDTITFSLSGTIRLGSQLPGVTAAGGTLIIDGAGRSITISGNNAVSIFVVDNGAALTLLHLTVADANIGGGGGGAWSMGTLTVTNCTFSNNHANQGGGISVSGGTLTVSNSTFSGNTANINGGGIANFGTLAITGSTFSGNIAEEGGGIANNGTLTIANSAFTGNSTDAYDGGGISNSGPLTVTNSTFSGNSADRRGGGIYNFNTLTVSNSTFSGNSANSEGGAIDSNATLVITNSTFSGNSAPGTTGGGISNHSTATLSNTIIANGPSGDNCFGSFTDGGSNLVWGDTTCPGINADPKLGTLGDYGGFTETIPLLAGSSAIDTGNDATCAADDQRGRPRPQGAQCDIGAYEANATLTVRSVGTYDGWILESGENTTVGGTLDSTATTFNLGDGTLDKQYRAILHFNTVTLPDTAVITKVTLKIRKQGLVGTDPFTILGGLKVDMRKPFFGTAGLVIGDFNATAGRVGVATFGATPVSNWYSALLSATGRAYVNKTGNTQFRLYFVKDDNNDNGADYMKFFSGNHTTASARPTLIIEYYVP